MTFEEFQTADRRELGGVLLALWLDGRGDWTGAHEIAQQIDDREGALVHAYLHRKEGDASNAAYWYRRAGRPTATGPFTAEWESMVREFLSRG